VAAQIQESLGERLYALGANLPFEGGMKSFLTYTARWEIDTIKRLKQHYTLQTAE
jgi:hypothetical protein